MKNRIHMATILGLALFVPLVGYAKISLQYLSREKNSFGFDPEEKKDDGNTVYISKQDCQENINIKFKITDDSSIDGDLYLVAGKKCNTDHDKGTDDCVYIDDVGAGGQFEKRVRDLLMDFDSAEDCSGDSNVNVWAARLDDPDARDENDLYRWSTEKVIIDYDMNPPAAPTGISAGPGENKVEITWDIGEEKDGGTSGEELDEDVEWIRILYDSKFDDSTTSDTSGERDTSNTDSGGDGGVPWDAGVPSDANSIHIAVDRRALETCSEGGGFEKGAPYTSDFEYDETSYPRDGKEVVKNLKNQTRYRFAAVAFDKHRNPSPLSEVVCATPDKTINFWDRYKEAGGKGGDFCFIATAAFGSYDHPVVRLLRVFRDRFLAEIPGGVRLIAAYYAVGPDLAEVVADHPVLKTIVQVGLVLFAGLTIPLSLLGPLGALLLGLTLFTGVFVSRRRRR